RTVVIRRHVVIVVDVAIIVAAIDMHVGAPAVDVSPPHILVPAPFEWTLHKAASPRSANYAVMLASRGHAYAFEPADTSGTVHDRRSTRGMNASPPAVIVEVPFVCFRGHHMIHVTARAKVPMITAVVYVRPHNALGWIACPARPNTVSRVDHR